MGFLDSALGSLMGGNAGAGSMEQAVAALLQQHGGIGGLVTQLTQGGLGTQVASWIGNGQNQAVTATEITQALGSGSVGALAQKLGINPQEAGELLAKALPHLVDHLTPGGQLPANATQVPSGSALTAAVEAIASRLLA
jgi:uncharacterized protein YidB (DUF937 family)